MQISWNISLLAALTVVVLLCLNRRKSQKYAQTLAELEHKYQDMQMDTEQRFAEMTRSLRDSEEQLSTTLKYAPDAVYICERSGHIVYANDTAVETLGYSYDELCGMTVYDLVPLEWREVYRQKLAKILTGHEHHVYEIRQVGKDGRKLPIELNVALLPNDRLYGSCRDITERKKVQHALRDSQDNLQRLLNSVAEGIYGVDVDGICTFVNAAFLRILGFDEADKLVGQNMHNLIHHSRADGSPYPGRECRMYLAFKSRKGIHVDDEVFWRRDGTAVTVEYWSHPIIKDGAVLGAVATFLDISKRKQAENEDPSAGLF